MKEKKNTLADWNKIIAKEVPYVDIKPYSHNIISIALMAIYKELGKKAANDAIKKFGLTKLGWKTVKE